MILDPTGTTLLAVSDAGTRLRATIDYDGHQIKGLSNPTVGPLLGKGGKPLLDDSERDSEGMTLIEGTPTKGTAYVSFERHHGIDRYPFDAERFGPPTASVLLPAGTNAFRGIAGLRRLPSCLSVRSKVHS